MGNEELFKRVLLISKGPGLFLLSIVFAFSPIQDRGRGVSRAEHRLQPGKRVTGEVILCCVVGFGSSVKGFIPMPRLNIL